MKKNYFEVTEGEKNIYSDKSNIHRESIEKRSKIEAFVRCNSWWATYGKFDEEKEKEIEKIHFDLSGLEWKIFLTDGHAIKCPSKWM